MIRPRVRHNKKQSLSSQAKVKRRTSHKSDEMT